MRVVGVVGGGGGGGGGEGEGVVVWAGHLVGVFLERSWGREEGRLGGAGVVISGVRRGEERWMVGTDAGRMIWAWEFELTRGRVGGKK